MGTRKDSKGRVLRKGESQREKYYIFQYTDANHKRHVIYAKDLPELRLKEKPILRDLEDGLDISKRENRTLNDAFDLYMSGRSDLKHASKMSYKYLYNHYIRNEFGNHKLVQLTYSNIRAFYVSLTCEKELSKKTLTMISSLINQVLQVAVRDNVLRTNPAERVMGEVIRRYGLKEKKRHPLTIEQQARFMKYAVEHPEFEEWIPILIMLLGTGCRIGEVLGLCWEDVDFERKNIYIRRSRLYKAQDSGKTEYYISTPKTEAGNRVIPMMTQVEQALLLEKEYQKKRDTRTKGFRKPVVDGYTNFVFTNPKFKQGLYHLTVVNRVIKRIVESYNEQEERMAEQEGRSPVCLPVITCHNLRHTFCTRFCENETNLKVIQDIMGHASITTTMNRYAEATEAKKLESIRNLENKIVIM